MQHFFLLQKETLRKEKAVLELSRNNLSFWHLTFTPDLPVIQSQNPHNSAAITAVLLNPARQIWHKPERQF